MKTRGNAEGVYYLQPRVARASALPRGSEQTSRPNPEGVGESGGAKGNSESRECKDRGATPTGLRDSSYRFPG